MLGQVLKFVIFSSFFINYCNTRNLYVYSENDQCKKLPRLNVHANVCKPLNCYVQNAKQFFTSNTTLIFFPGTHILSNKTTIIQIDNVVNFALEGMQQHNSTINCSGSKTGFYFRNSTNIRIENITICGCGGLVVPQQDCAALAFDSVYNLSLIQVRVSYSHGFGIYANKVLDSALILQSVFEYNRGNNSLNGGNVHFRYHECKTDSKTQINITSSRFLHGYDVKKKSNYSYATGLTLLIHCLHVNVNITNITAINNTADNGGNIAIQFKFTGNRDEIGSVSLYDSCIIQGKGHRGGGLRVWSKAIVLNADNVSKYSNTVRVRTVLEVVNTEFIGNKAEQAGGALYISHYEQDKIDYIVHHLKFVNCKFSQNSVPAFGNGAVTEIIKHKIISHQSYISPQFEVNFKSCNFNNNWIILNDIEIVHGAIMDIFSVSRVNFDNCTFINNNSTAISVVGSNIHFSGELTFENNSAVNGGAIKFCDTSAMFINNNTHIFFKDNKAKFFGGAIYAQQRCLETATPCFFQPDVPDFTHITDLTKTMQLTFSGNKAKRSGDALYGGSIDRCYTYQHFISNYTKSYFFSGKVFNGIFNTEKNNSIISSDPYGVCLCDHNHNINCSKKEYNISDVYRGKQFTIYAVPVGQRKGIAPAVIIANPVDHANHKHLNQMKQNYLSPAKQCQALRYSINSSLSIFSFNLTALTTTFLEDTFYYKFHPPKIRVRLQPCPWGYVSSKDNGSEVCTCDNYLLSSYDIECKTKHQSIVRQRTVWIGSNWTNTTNSKQPGKPDLLVNKCCPYMYCKLQKVYVTSDTVDGQCNYNRIGILCGACKKGLSVGLGGSECFKCTNVSLLLTAIFALMGLVLVLSLIFLNLTVTEGSINGIIFYANVIQINRDVYFPERTPFLTSIPLTAISWLNLDFGFRTCFYKGMDMFAKAILQYLFPVYIWLVVMVIVLISRKYTLAQKLIGKNAVKILATLFLLSIAKLCRAVIMSLANTVIHSSHGYQYNVWLADGNVFYLHGKHVFLFLLGSVFSILIVAYSCLITLIQCIQRAPYKPPFTYIIRLKPLLDAYTGPYKNKYRFWTGFLLFVRIILYVLLSYNDLNNEVVKLSIVAITCFFVLFLQSAFQGVYTKKTLDVLEASFTLNLGLLSVSSCLIESMHKQNENKQIIVSTISVCIALFQFLVIIMYQCYTSIRGSALVRACWLSITSHPMMHRRLTDRDQNNTVACTSQTEVTLTPENTDVLAHDLHSNDTCLQIPPFVDFSSPRERLLESPKSQNNYETL